MADRESIITHLQIVHTWAEFARERDLQFFTPKHLEDIAQWSDDAITLLKEQEEEIENIKQTAQSMMEGVCLLKEQEAVEPTWQQGKAYCGSCGKRIPLKIGARFCHKCGKPILWEGRRSGNEI